MKGKCQWEGCIEPAKFGIYWLKGDGSKAWVLVCDRHERLLAKRNLKAANERDLADIPKRL